MSLEGTETLSEQTQKQNLLAPLNNEAQKTTKMAEMGYFFTLQLGFHLCSMEKNTTCCFCLSSGHIITSSFYSHFPFSTIITPSGPYLLASLCVVNVLRGMDLA